MFKEKRRIKVWNTGKSGYPWTASVETRSWPFGWLYDNTYPAKVGRTASEAERRLRETIEEVGRSSTYYKEI